MRYPQTEVPDDGVLASLERAYADAMIPVYETYGDDPDIAAIYIDSQIMLTPLQIYDIDKCTLNPEAREREIQAALVRSLAGTGVDHIGVLHFDIHVQEMSPTPERRCRRPAGCRKRRPLMPATCSICRRTFTLWSVALTRRRAAAAFPWPPTSGSWRTCTAPRSIGRSSAIISIC